ncbi:hypothetical protein LPJ66_006489 [Kickxella alabastrina]|uniref:Uncharacterized protein n=1 Tax=Kickxella alabastrina TaxID=61397 RepID=A0ACC1IFV8_9FUNG|nr:hypothetical protein LPJ66_006489 [Kickxella alabastrina]
MVRSDSAAAAAAEAAACSLPSPQMHASDFVHGSQSSSIVSITCSSNITTGGSSKDKSGCLVLPDTVGQDAHCAIAHISNTDKCGFTRANSGLSKHSSNPESDISASSSRPISTIMMVAATAENSHPVLNTHGRQASAESNWFKRQTMRSNTNASLTSFLSQRDERHSQYPEQPLPHMTEHHEKLMLRAQEQRDEAMAEANQLQIQLDYLRQSSNAEIQRLQAEVDAAMRNLRVEYNLRTAAETKCSLMECELAELSSNIQYEAQNLVVQERREHRDELDRMAKRHAEIDQLLVMERSQVGALKQSLESTTVALDRERVETERMRSGMQAFERQTTPYAPASASTAGAGVANGSSVSASAASGECENMAGEPHISGLMYFGNDASRTDIRLTEFLDFLNVVSEKEVQGSTFMQRCMREDIGPTLMADVASGLPSLSSWHRHRRLLHGVQENTLVLESFSPRTSMGRVLSLGCYLCGCSINRPLTPKPGSLSDHRLSLSSGDTVGRNVRCEMYRMRFSDNDEDNKPLCHHCHGRMVAVCSFFSYLKIVRKGLIKRPIADIWLEVNKNRLQMWLARSGASPESKLAIAIA